MSNKNRARLGWILFAIAVAGALINLIVWASHLLAPPTPFDLAETLIWLLAMPVIFAVVAALIINRQPQNRVGWLMMLVAIANINPISTFIDGIAAPTVLTPGLFLLFWLEAWSWIPVIFPVFLIPLHFPTGRPPSPRWNWVNWLAVGLWVFFMVIIPFAETISLASGAWALPNPIGFIPDSVINGPFLIGWGIGLVTVIGASVASLFVRYRNAQAIEREQIKWLLYAGAFFAVTYALTFFLTPVDESQSGWGNLWFVLSILLIPIAIAIAILRYRLYDIDVIIRKTLVYGLLTALLAFVYFGSIVLLQTLFDRLTGQQSPIIIVLSTLLIAALFTPLRRRVQDVIDRRFFRKKYDAAQVLADFARHARDETDLDSLTAELARVVGETMQPERVGIVAGKFTQILRTAQFVMLFVTFTRRLSSKMET